MEDGRIDFVDIGDGPDEVGDAVGQGVELALDEVGDGLLFVATTSPLSRVATVMGSNCFPESALRSPSLWKITS